MTINLLAGSEAQSALGDHSFLIQWEKLYHSCAWATPFQSIGYVTTWYEVYQGRFDPFILCESDDQGNLIGLLTLATDKNTGQITPAGAHQAEYHVWLAAEQNGNAFIEHALEAIKDQVKNAALMFKYLPPTAPISWLAANTYWAQFAALVTHRRPLVMLDDEVELSARLKRSSKKNRLNVLQQMGDVRFEQVQGEDKLAALFDEIITLYDFRQGAVNNSLPFRDDPLKKRFHLALMRVPNLLHVTILKVGPQIAAAILGIQDHKEVALGIVAHSPFYARFSPGTLHLLMLSTELARQGYGALDLTPGGDPWKERFANNHDQVCTLRLFFRSSLLRKHRRNEKLKSIVKKAITICGLDPKNAMELISRVRRVRFSALSNGLHVLPKIVWSKVEYRIYVFSEQDAKKLDGSMLMKRNCLQDLIAFEPNEIWPTRQQFLSRCLERIEAGESVYTLAEHGKLLHYGWLVECQARAFFSEVQQEYAYPPNSASLCDFYTHLKARARGFFQAALRQMLHDAATIPGTEWIYISVLAHNAPARHVIEKLGFTYAQSIFKNTILGRTRRRMNELRIETKK